MLVTLNKCALGKNARGPQATVAAAFPEAHALLRALFDQVSVIVRWANALKISSLTVTPKPGWVRTGARP